MNGMNMSHSFDAMDLIVFAVLLFTIGMFVAWLVSPKLRVWIERPKYRFLANVETYDSHCYSKEK